MTPACAGMAPLFDADVAGESYHSRQQRLTFALGICNNKCQVVDACERASQDAASEGVWAGRLRESLHVRRNSRHPENVEWVPA